MEVSENVEGLLLAVKATNDFESDMAQRFGGGQEPSMTDVRLRMCMSLVHVPMLRRRTTPTTGAAPVNWPGVPSAAPMARKTRPHSPLSAKPSFLEASPPSLSPTSGALLFFKGLGVVTGVSMLSLSLAEHDCQRAMLYVLACKHINHTTRSFYVEAEEKQLMATLEALMRDEAWTPTEEIQRTGVLKSASDLFAVVKKSLLRCSRFVSRGRPMLDLSRAFARVISAYSKQLLARIPRPPGWSLSVQATPPSTALLSAPEWHVKLADGDPAVLCSIVSTSEYCRELVGQLERSVVKQLADPRLGEQVDMHSVEDAFASVVSDCLAALVLGTETAADSALVTMTRCNWGGVEVVGDQSDWVGVISRVVVGTAAVVGKLLSEVVLQYG